MTRRGIVLAGIVVLDVIHIMAQLPKVHDERENLQQLVIERNCSFAAIFSLAAALLYQTWQHRADHGGDRCAPSRPPGQPDPTPPEYPSFSKRNSGI